MKKRILSMTLALCLVFGTASALPQGYLGGSSAITAAAANSEKFTVGGIEYYKIDSKTAGVYMYSGNSSSVTIPKTVNGMTVTEISEEAFVHRRSLKSVELPETLKSIGDYAFSNCEALETITLPSSLTKLGEAAFSSCLKLKTINIPDGITELPANLFCSCWSLNNITIPSSIKIIGDSAFFDCKKLEDVNLPDSITEIQGWAFSGCPLQKMVLPNGLKTIGDEAFSRCGSLTEINIPNTVTSIGKSAFFQCRSLETVTIPDSVKSIGDKAMGLDESYNSETCTSTYKPSSDFRMIYANNTAARNYAESNGVNFARRLAGSNRYATAAEISKNTYASAKTVVIASGESYADALAGVPYAKSIGAPILLTTKDKLPAETLAEIKGIGAKNAVILGGTGAVSDSVKTELESNGLKTERISGNSRYATAASIAKKTNSAPTDIFFVVGTSYADALSVSSVAAIKKAPIVYLTTDGKLNADTAAYLAKLKAKGCVKNAYVIGGEGAISSEMMQKASDALGVNAVRIAGSDRYSTGIAINEKFSSLFVKGTACLATGTNFPDALAGGVFAAYRYAPLVLTSPTVTEPQHKYFMEHPAKAVYVFGGDGAVSEMTIRDSTRPYNT